MGFLCDCFAGKSKRTPSKLDQRPRFVEPKHNPPSYSSLPTNVTLSAWRPNRDANRNNANSISNLTAEDEKHLLQMAIDAEEDENEDERDENEEDDNDDHEQRFQIDFEQVSPQSSTISLPSTRITARTIGTDRTGASSPGAHSRQSEDSHFTTGAPPSYRPRSGASRVEDRSNRASWQSRNIVIDDEWFDQFGVP